MAPRRRRFELLKGVQQGIHDESQKALALQIQIRSGKVLKRSTHAAAARHAEEGQRQSTIDQLKL